MFIDRGDGVSLAYAYLPGSQPTTVFLPGFMSDMTGDKALAVQAWCQARGQACLRLDYSGHGASAGRFEDGTIGRWTQDALFLIEHLTQGKLILIGSSMGGWIALNAALALGSRVAALIGIAAAPDFTENLMWAVFTDAQRHTLMHEGLLRIPSAYGGAQIITRGLIEDGRQHLLLGAPIGLLRNPVEIDQQAREETCCPPQLRADDGGSGRDGTTPPALLRASTPPGLRITCPVRLLNGQCDPDVPWQTALRIAACLQSDDVRITLIKDGTHRLSRPPDIALLCDTLAGLAS